MRWSDIKFDLAIWTMPTTKNTQSLTIPLTVLAMQALSDRYERRKPDEWVFPSPKAGSRVPHITEPTTGWTSFLKRTGLKNFRLHDLRRTLGSYIAMNNQSLQMIGKVLGHRSPTSTQSYSRLAFDPVREALGSTLAGMTRLGDILPDSMCRSKGPDHKEPLPQPPAPWE